MIRIGILGDIGSGKSFVAKSFGYPVFNADNEVGKLYKKNRKIFFKLNKALPKYITQFPIKKQEITKTILANKNNLKKIVKIIHPEIRKKMNIFLKKNKKSKLIVLDIPLLIENKINKRKEPDKPGIVIPDTLIIPQKNTKTRFSFSPIGFARLRLKPAKKPIIKNIKRLLFQYGTCLITRYKEANIIPRKDPITRVSF